MEEGNGADRPGEDPGGEAAVIVAVRERMWRWLPAEAPIFLFYLLLALFLTWPVIVKLKTSMYGFPSDNVGGVWLYWWYRNAVSFGAKASFCPLIGFPFGSHINVFPLEPVSELVVRSLLLFLNEVVVYNIRILLSFLISGITMYYLVRYLTKNKWAAFFGGFAYLIGGYHAVSAMLYANLSITQWMPLYILTLLVFIKAPTVKNAVLMGLAALLVGGTCVHYGLFMALFTGAFLIGHFAFTRVTAARAARQQGIPKPRLSVNRRTLILSLTVAVIVLTTFVLFYLAFTLNQFPQGRWKTTGTPSQARDLRITYLGGAKPWDYLLPQKMNPVFGAVTEKILGNNTNWFNNSLYIGWVIIALAVVFLVVFLRRGGRPPVRGPGENDEARPGARSESEAVAEDRAVVWGFLVAALGAFIFSLPPYVMLGSIKFPLPSLVFKPVASWFRWYLRAGVVVQLCLIVLACFGISFLFKRMKVLPKELVLVLLIGLLFLESTLVPPFRYFEFEQPPKLVQDMTRLPEKATLALYPAFEFGLFASANYTFYQRWHKKKMLNGAPQNSDGEALRRTVFNPFNKQTPAVLSRFGINHLVYYGQLAKSYEGASNTRDEILQLPDTLKLVASAVDENPYGDGYLYRIESPKANLVPVYLGDITVPHLERGKETTRFLAGTGVIRVENYSGKAFGTAMKLPVTAIGYQQRLTLVDTERGHRTLWSGRLEPRQQAEIVIPHLVVPKGGMKLELRAAGKKSELTEGEIDLYGAHAAFVKMGDVLFTPF